jgi:hypothetical protein
MREGKDERIKAEESGEGVYHQYERFCDWPLEPPLLCVGENMFSIMNLAWLLDL